MNILIWVLFGGLAGWIATLFTGDDAAYGVFGNIIVGIAGAVIGGWIADAFTKGDTGTPRPSSIWGFVVAVLGAILLLAIVNWIA